MTQHERIGKAMDWANVLALELAGIHGGGTDPDTGAALPTIHELRQAEKQWETSYNAKVQEVASLQGETEQLRHYLNVIEDALASVRGIASESRYARLVVLLEALGHESEDLDDPDGGVSDHSDGFDERCLKCRVLAVVEDRAITEEHKSGQAGRIRVTTDQVRAAFNAPVPVAESLRRLGVDISDGPILPATSEHYMYAAAVQAAKVCEERNNQAQGETRTAIHYDHIDERGKTPAVRWLRPITFMQIVEGRIKHLVGKDGCCAKTLTAFLCELGIPVEDEAK